MSSETEKKFSVGLIVPLYKSWTHVTAIIDYVNYLCSQISGSVTATFVVDGCDKSEHELRENIQKFRCPVRLIVLSKNFGVGPALRAAMSRQTEDYSIAFGSDLQEPRELFIQFADELLKGDLEFVFGQRVNRDDPFITRLFSQFYWFLNRKLIFKDCPSGGFDVYGCNSVAREALVNLSEHRTNITSQMLWLGFRRKFLAFDRVSRFDGKSTWSFRKKIGLFIDSFVGFSVVFLRVGITQLTLAPVVFALGTKFENIDAVLTTLALIQWLFGGILVAPYLVRFFDESRNRPTFVIRSEEYYCPAS